MKAKTHWLKKFDALDHKARRRRLKVRAYLVTRDDWEEIDGQWSVGGDVVRGFRYLSFNHIPIYESHMAWPGQPRIVLESLP